MQRYRFDAYVDAARNGRNALWRIALAIVLIVSVWAAASFALFCAGVAAMLVRDDYLPADLDDILYAYDFREVLADPIGVVVTLLSIAALWIGVWLAVRAFHRRPLSSVFGIGRRLHWPDFIRSALVTLAVVAVTTAFGLLVDPTITRGSISLARWFAMAPLVLVCCFLQSSAEELFFRGYLQQTLAARFKTPLIWLLIPTVLFTLLHWSSAASTVMNLATLFIILCFSLSMTVLLMASGNLAAGMGAHFANNIIAIMFFSSQPDLGAASLYAGRSILDPDWTLWQAAAYALYSVMVIAIAQILLLHHASPVRLPSRR